MKLTEYDPWKKSSVEYALDVGAPKFELVPVKQQKDLMINAARMNAEQEYNRIMELVKVLQKQAEDIKRRLWITDLVHAAEYRFQIYPGGFYWLIWDHIDGISRLSNMGPDDWTTGAPDKYEYVCKIQWLGDQTWREVTD
jgi:hypothetical protein